MGAFFYQLASFLVNHLPLKFCYWIADRVAGVYYIFARSSRRVVRSNLAHIFQGRLNRKEERFYIKQTFCGFSRYLVEFFFSSSLNRKNIGRLISVENLHYIDEALKDGKGVISLTAHFGNWELGGIAMGLKDYPMNVVALNHKNEAVNKFFVNRRESKQIKIIPLGSAIRRCFYVLRENEILALLGDREFNKREMGIKINFCGRETRPCIPKGAAKLALKTGAKIIPTLVIKDKNNYSRLVFSKPLDVVSSGDEEKDVRRIMEEFFAVFETYLKENPAQWFIFYPMWEEIS